ncbi:non-ribosomal peptide synthetase [Streptomyces piniterrae]|uniref:non-ribosomal peptide synthetase n=1 Tax=Streptomyces piniterrae TaxID=2571125 RepID=UPI00145C3FE1|nr:non-ribosomal peptide synthetase [Streptomyces piniterrae]
MSGTSYDFAGIGRRLAEHRRHERHTEHAAHPPGRRTDDGPVPLSSAQEGLWLFEQLFPGTSVNHLSYCGAVDGELDIPALTVALRKVMERHDILRTGFVGDPAGAPHGAPPRQVVRPEAAIEPRVVDLTGLPGPDREPEALRQARLLAAAPWDLREGPLLRVAVFLLSGNRSLLLVTAHHLIADGWSLGVFFDELAAAYTGADTPPHPPQYASVAGRRQPADPRALAHWREVLRGQEALQLPADGPRPAARRFRSATVPVRLPRELGSAVRQLAAETGTTPFMVLLTAFQAVLSRMSGQYDISVGSPTAMRQRAQAPDVIGPLVNMLVLRTDLGAEPTFRAALRRVRRTCLDAFAHQDVPFERLVEELGSDRDLGRGPLFQTMLVLQDEPAELWLGELRVTPVLLEPSAVQHEAELYLWSGGEEFHGFLGYDTDVFRADSAERLVDRFLTLLGAAVADPDRPLGRLPVLGEEEHRLVTRLAAGEAVEVPERCVHELFEEQADRVPDAPAVHAVDGTLGYRDLERRANRLAHHLRAHGVGPETLVGVCLDRTGDLVTALLAVLKAGGAYVPLDPNYPADRIHHILRDASATLLVTTGDHASGLPDGPWSLTVLDREREAIAARPAHRPDARATPLNAAYTIYTSGSTGHPKGVVIEHRQTAALLAWAHTAYTPDQLRNTLASTSVCFDLSVYEIFAPLSLGAALTLTHGTALDLITAPGPHRPTLLNTVPSIAQELLLQNALPPSATTINLAGEPLPPALVDDLYRQPHIEEVHNLYGPTEDTTYSTHHHTVPGSPQTPIGRPLPNTRAHVLDDQLQPLPLGTVGELYLTGDGTTRGYHRHPRQTAERYLPNPLTTHGGDRLYRTGDLVSRHPDGHLLYHGRSDTQIKIHGYRIEPAEIETALLTHPAVQQAALTTHDNRLHAHVVAPGLDGSPHLLKKYLQTKLPHHLTPHHFTFHTQLPTTPNHKIDYKALPPPRELAPTASHQPPTTPTQKLIAAHWKDVLDTPDPGLHDSFFTHGGHSLLATRLIARLARETGTPVPLHLLFRHPTIAELAEAIDALEEGEAAGIPRLDRAGRTTADGSVELPASFGQERLLFLCELDPQAHLAYHMPGGVRIRGPLDATALGAALDAVVQRHEALRTALRRSDEGVHQVVGRRTRTALRHVDLTGSTRPEDALRALTEAESETPFDLAEGPLFRATLATLGTDDHALLVTLHHTVSDGWSLTLLLDELTAHYTAQHTHTPPELPPLPVQYADHAAWQQHRLATGDLAYWRTHLAGVPPLPLPTDHPRPPQQTFHGATRPLHIDRTLTTALEQLAAAHDATPFMALLTVYQGLLARISGQSRITVGTPTSGRGHPDTENVIGFFVNSLALHTDLGGDPTFREALERVRRSCLDAYAHQDVPFERLVAELQPRRDPSRSPLFQTMFALHDAPPPDLGIPGLDCARLAVPRRTSQFDLTLSLDRTDDGLTGELVYNTDLFDEDTAARMTRQFLDVLTAAVTDPDRRLSGLLVLSDEEARRAAHLAAEAARTTEPASREPLPYRPPVTATQQLVAGVWSEVLDTPHPGIDDDFFAHGGHSILAGRIVNRLRGKTGTAIPLRLFMERPTIAALAEHLSASESTEPAAIPPLERVPGPDGRCALPASFGQERLWFLSELDPRAHLAYHLTGGARIRGPLDIDALRHALTAVTRRHETLRTALRHNGAGIDQLIGPPEPMSLTRTDLSGAPDPDAALRQLLAHQAELPFDLAEGPLFRATLATLGTDDHALLLAMHHTVSDGWSLTLLLDELTTHYTAHRDRADAALPPLSVQYADHAAWQQHRLTTGDLDDDLAYWRTHLAGLRPLPLPTDRPHPPRQTFHGATHPVHLDRNLTAALEQLAAAHGATPFMALLTAFEALLLRLSGRTDIAIGSPVAGRQHPELENLIGFFVNTLVLRTDLSGEPTFRAALERVWRTCLDAYAHQDVPFERLVSELQPQRDLSRSPLFQTMLILNAEPAAYALPGLDVAPLRPPRRTSQFDLTLSLDRTDEGLTGDLIYNTDLFDEATAARIADHFLTLLTTAVAHPDRPLGELLVLSDEEARRAAQLAAAADDSTGAGAPEPLPYRPPVTAAQQLVAAVWSEVLDTPRPGIDDDFFVHGGHSLLATRLTTRLTQKIGAQVPLHLVFQYPTVAGLAEHLPAATGEAPASIPRLNRRLRSGTPAEH